MAYSFMTIQKVKSMGTLQSKYNHNCRKIEVSNVIPAFINDNDTLVRLPEVDGQEVGYADAVKSRINELDYYKTHNLRPDQVLAYEVVMTFSRDADIDIEEWEKRSVQWLKDTFNVAPDQKNNIIHAICHKDEPGNVHIHAIVTPVDDTGKLNAKFFTGGSRAMSQLQSSYAECVEDLGLERGIAGSSAKHKDIRKFYADLNNTIENVPEVLEGETAEQYRQRTFELQQAQLAAMLKKKYDMDQKIRAKRDRDFDNARRAFRSEFEIHNQSVKDVKELIEGYKLQVGQLEEKITSNETIVSNYEEQIKELSLELASLKKTVGDINELKEDANKMYYLREGLLSVKEQNPGRVADFENEMNQYISIGQELINAQLLNDEEHIQSID